MTRLVWLALVVALVFGLVITGATVFGRNLATNGTQSPHGVLPDIKFPVSIQGVSPMIRAIQFPTALTP